MYGSKPRSLYLLLLLIAASIGLAACSATTTVASPDGVTTASDSGWVVPQPQDGNTQYSDCTSPESDNDYYYNRTCIRKPLDAFSLTVRVSDEMANHSTVNAEGSGSGFVVGGVGSYSSSFRMWQEGKGLLPVEVLSISPDTDYVNVGDYIILKTSDLKAMAIPNGAVVTFVCNMDLELLSPVARNQTLTANRITYELDNCRMAVPSYQPSE